MAQDKSFTALSNLLECLEVIASQELKPETPYMLEEVPLREILDSLRIVVEPGREIEERFVGTCRTKYPLSLRSHMISYKYS